MRDYDEQMTNEKLSKGITIATLALMGASVVMIILKLCGVLHWGWWIVTAGLWGALVLFFALFCVVFAAVVVFNVLQARQRRKLRKMALKNAERR